MRLLQGYRHVVLGLTDDQAKLVVLADTGGIEDIARRLIERCPAARLTGCSPTRAVITHAEFRCELMPSRLGARAILLDIRRPDLDMGDAIAGMPTALGGYVSAVTGSRWLGVAASLGALKLLDRLTGSLARPPERRRMRVEGGS